MRIIDPSHEFIVQPDRETTYRRIAEAMRNCYRADLNEKPKTDEEMVEQAVRLGHDSLLEHASVGVNIICDRGVSHELVRHRIAAYAQESTRYCNYSGGKFGRELTFVRPSWVHGNGFGTAKHMFWEKAMADAERAYMNMLDNLATPQEARAVLPNSLATKIAITANMREWIHIFRMRVDTPAHPDMRQTMKPILMDMLDEYPHIFQPVCDWLANKGALK